MKMLNRMTQWLSSYNIALKFWSNSDQEARAAEQYGDRLETLAHEGSTVILQSSVLLSEFFEVWTDHMMLVDIGGHLTCTEAEALKDLLVGFGQHSAAESLIDGHAESDEEGDRHYRSAS